MQHGDGRAVEPAISSGKGDITVLNRRRRGETQRQRVARRCTVDGPIMVLKLLVALGLIGTGVYIHRLKEAHVEGTLPESSYETSIAQQKRLAYLLTLIGGVYVAGAALIGCMGRLARRRSLYCFYYCTTILGSTLLLLVAAWPLSMVNSPGGYCMAAEDHCKHVASLAAECPVTMRLLATVSPMLSSETEWGPGGATGSFQMEKRALQQKQEAHCCYQDDFVVYCSTLLGAFWLSTILASALAALNILQSSISCCVFWGLFDTADWTSQQMPGRTKPQTAAVFTPSTAPATGSFESVEDSLGSTPHREQVHREAVGASQNLSCNSGAEQGPGMHCTDSSKDSNFMSVV